MAAYNYYSNHPSTEPSPYHDYADRNDYPLPPLPPKSPYDDRKRPYAHSSPSRSYSRASERLHQNTDPFDDDHAIPLNSSGSKNTFTHTVSPIPRLEDEDQYVRDAEPRKRRRRGSKKSGWFRGKITWVVFVLTFVQLVVFIVELVKMGVLTGTPIEIKPSFNPMIGPSPYVLINMGARYQPCMHTMDGVQNSPVAISWPCPNATATTGDSVTCQLSSLCGFSSNENPRINGTLDDKPAPDQWWRFIVPIFLHAGIIHISFNLLLQLTLGRDVEKLIGSVRFAILYFAAGIFGFVLGGNFAATGIASTGCSGSLFGILAITLLDLLYHWKERESPIRDLLFILVDVCIAFILGLLPGLDNFSHIGGFLMGLVLGVCLLRSPHAIARRTSEDPAAYENLHRTEDHDDGLKSFAKQPLGFFKNRRGVWWAWWLLRVAALLATLLGFILLLKNFYIWRHTCSWCKYLSCLPVTVGGSDWCTVGNLNFTPTNGTSSKRDLLALIGNVFEGTKYL